MTDEYIIPLGFGGFQVIPTSGSTNGDISKLVCEYERANGGSDTENQGSIGECQDNLFSWIILLVKGTLSFEEDNQLGCNSS